MGASLVEGKDPRFFSLTKFKQMNRFILLCVSVVVSRSPALARGEAEDTLASLVVQGHAGRSPRVRACKNKTKTHKKKLWVQGLLSYFGPSVGNAVDVCEVMMCSVLETHSWSEWTVKSQVHSGGCTF